MNNILLLVDTIQSNYYYYYYCYLLIIMFFFFRLMSINRTIEAQEPTPIPARIRMPSVKESKTLTPYPYTCMVYKPCVFALCLKYLNIMILSHKGGNRIKNEQT